MMRFTPFTKPTIKTSHFPDISSSVTCVCLLFSFPQQFLSYSPLTSSFHLFPKSLRRFICHCFICFFYPLNIDGGGATKQTTVRRAWRGNMSTCSLCMVERPSAFSLHFSKRLIMILTLASSNMATVFHTHIHLHTLWYDPTIKPS